MRQLRRSIGVAVVAALAWSAADTADAASRRRKPRRAKVTKTATMKAAPAPAVAPVLDVQTATAAPAAIERLVVVAGGSTVVMTSFDIKRVAVTNPTVAEAHVVERRELLVDGKGPGTVSLILWGDSQRRQFEVVVEPPPSLLQQQLRSLFPDEDIRVNVSEEAIILAGRVRSNAVALRAAEIAEKSSSKSRVINLLELPGGSANQQVMLQVRVAEVNHRALVELGASLFTTPTGNHNFVGRSATQQFSAPDFDELRIVDGSAIEGRFSFSDFLNLFVLNTKYDIGILIKALKSRGFFQSLAEPTLIAYNGQEASFLAGGEIPIPITQGLAGGITVTYKEFGVRLTFRPTIAGNVIRMKVKPEVSSLDFSSGITLQGFRIPALSTRRAETEVELQDGQSFAIGGLLNNISQEDRAKIPLLGDVPIVGHLFRSRAERKERTELVVLITPRLVRPLDPGEVPVLPTVPDYFFRSGEEALRDLQGDKKKPGGTQ